MFMPGWNFCYDNTGVQGIPSVTGEVSCPPVVVGGRDSVASRLVLRQALCCISSCVASSFVLPFITSDLVLPCVASGLVLSFVASGLVLSCVTSGHVVSCVMERPFLSLFCVRPCDVLRYQSIHEVFFCPQHTVFPSALSLLIFSFFLSSL